MLERERSNVPLTEEFTERAWLYYDSFENETKEYLATQNHVDLRTFLGTSGEEWTKGTYGYTSTLENYPALLLPVSKTVETQSSTPKRPVDLLTGFSGTDILTFALPNFPLSVVNTKQSTIEITSDPFGQCSNTKLSAIVNLQQSLDAMIEGDSQFAIERSILQQNEIDLGAITGVRFKIVCNGSETGTVSFMGLKLILGPTAGKKGWVIPSVDYDNWNGMLRKPTPLNGNVTNGPILEQGILWRSELLPGYNDPTPVDTEFGIVINPGSQVNQNEVTLYMREESEIFQTQLDLIGITQAQLDGHPQPDIGSEEFLPRTVGELDKQEMIRLDHLETMEDLERVPVENPVEQSWIYFNLKWGEGHTRLVMNNSSALGYSFPKVTAMTNHTEYLMVCSLEDSSARVRIFELNKDKSVNQEPIFDSTLIEDDGVFRRRQGRIGWKARLGDADAYINSIRPRSVVFAEYRSTPLLSLTPVDGAQLFASFTANENLWNQGFEVYPEDSSGVILTRDSVRTLSGESFRVDTNATETNVGITTDLIEFIDFTQAEIRFAIWFEGEPRNVGTETVHRHRTFKELEELGGSSYGRLESLFDTYKELEAEIAALEEVMESNVIARLVSDEGTIIPLPMPGLETNQWQEIVLPLPTDQIVQTGKYYVQILQPTLKSSSWWIDDVSIFERAVQWSARSTVSNPWNSNYAPWTDFRDIVNVNRKGILLAPRGKELQLRGRALRQNAMIKAPKIVPRYASLGRLVFPEENLVGHIAPTAHFKQVGVGKTFSFTDESTAGTGAIGQREWNFGDGEFTAGNELFVEHTYALPGTYYVTLVTIDRNGLRSQYTETATIF